MEFIRTILCRSFLGCLRKRGLRRGLLLSAAGRFEAGHTLPEVLIVCGLFLMITSLVGELTSAAVRTNNECVSDTQQFRDLASAADRLSRELRWCEKVLWPASPTAQSWGEGCSFASSPGRNFYFVYQRRAAAGKIPQIIGLSWNCRDKCLYKVVYNPGFKVSSSALNRKSGVVSERLLCRNINYIGISSLSRSSRGGRLFVDLELRGGSASFSLKGKDARGSDGGVFLRTQVQIQGGE